MADTTRPFHWGRENPNYAGPQRAQADTDADLGVDPAGDFPVDSPLTDEDVLVEHLFDAAEDAKEITAEDLAAVEGVHTDPDAEACRAFGELRSEAVGELAGIVQERELSSKIVYAVADEVAEKIPAEAHAFAEDRPELACQYADLFDNPVEEMGRSYMDFGGISAVRRELTDGYARAVSERYATGSEALNDLLGRGPNNEVERAVIEAREDYGDSPPEPPGGGPRLLRRLYSRVVHERQRSVRRLVF